jgi:hypothetical protein
VRSLFSKDKHLYPGEPFFPLSLFRNGGASGKPSMAQLETSADLRPNESDKVAEILVCHFNPHSAVGPAFHRRGHAPIEIGCAKHSLYRTNGKRQYQGSIAWIENAIVEQGDLIGSYALDYIGFAAERYDIVHRPLWKKFLREDRKASAFSVADA